MSAARPVVLATVLLAGVAQGAGGGPQPRTVFEIGGVAAPSARGSNVFFEPLLDTAVVGWTTAQQSPKGCLVAVHALPIRPTSLGWDGKPLELLHAETSGCDHLPPTRVRALGGQLWGALAGAQVQLAGVDYDGKPVEPALSPYETSAAGTIDLYRVGDEIMLKSGSGVVGWKSGKPVKLGIKGIVAAQASGWLLTADGSLRRLSDPGAPGRGPAARVSPSPPADPPLLADDGDALVVAGCPGGAQVGVWRTEGDKPKVRKMFTGHGLGCPRAVRVTEDGRILIASQISGKDGRRQTAFVTLVGRKGNALGAPLRIDVDPSAERELGLAYAGGNGRLLWAVVAADGATVRGADFTVAKDKLVWSDAP
jgi:hypothetical protein